MRVDIAHQLINGRERVRRVQVVIHRLFKLLSALLQLCDHRIVVRAGLFHRVFQREIEAVTAAVKPRQRGLALLDDINAVVDRAAVLRRNHQVADRLIAIFLRHIAHGEEIAEGFRHLAVIHIDKAVVHPVMREGRAVAAFALRNLILMVREDQILPATVDIDRFAEIAAHHGGALDVPARAALAPRGIPARLARLRGLPERKIHGFLFHFANVDARTRLQLLQRLVGKLAVLREFRGAKIHVALRFIGIALFDQSGDDGDDLIDILRRLRVNGRLADIHPLGVHPELLDIFLRHLGEGEALLIGAADDLIVDIRKILHKAHVVAAVFKIAAQHIEHAQRAGVADVDIVINGGAAGIDFDLTRCDRFQFFLLPGQCVINLHEKSLLLFSTVILSKFEPFYKGKRSGSLPFPAFFFQFRVFTLQLLDAQHHAAKLLRHRVGHVHLIEVVNAHAVTLDNTRRHADRCGIRWDLLKHHCACGNVAVFPHLERAEHLRTRADHHIVADGRVTLARILARAAESNALIERHVVPDLRRFADDYARAMVDEEAMADLCGRVDFDPRFMRGALRNPTCQEKQPVTVAPIGPAVHPNGLQAGV